MNVPRTPPCKQDCPDRCAGCHGKCEKYLAFHEESKQIYAESDKYRAFHDVISCGVKSRMKTMHRKQAQR